MKANFKISLLILWMVAMGFCASAQAPSIAYTGSTALASGTAFTITPANTGGAVPATVYGKVTSIAGNPYGATGYVNGTGDNAQFNLPSAIVGDASGNIYMADYSNNAIRKITQAGVTTTFAGSSTGVSGFTNGTGTGALFNSPNGIAIDGSGNLYVSDAGNNAIRKITAAGVVTTLYQNAATAFGPAGLCIDPSGNVIVTAQSACQIWKITPAGVMTVVAGAGYTGFDDGDSADATFSLPGDVKRDASGNLYIADYYNNAIRKISPAGVVTTLSGGILMGYANGSGTTALFSAPTSVAVGSGNVIYVTDFNNNDIRRVMPDGTTSLVAGSPAQVAGMTDSVGTAAGFNEPTYIYIDGNGNGYTLEFIGRVRKIALTGYTLKGTLPAGLTFNSATGTISGTPTGTITATTDTITAFNASGYSTAMVNFTAGSGLPTIVYGSQSYTYTPGTPITTLTPTVTGNPVPYTGYTTTYAHGTNTGANPDGTGLSLGFTYPAPIAVDNKGNKYITEISSDLVYKITPNGVISTLHADDQAAQFEGLTADTSGNLYATDFNHHAIRKITAAGTISLFAGGTQGYADGTGAAAQFSSPAGIVRDGSGNFYMTDALATLSSGASIRKITPSGVVTTIAGGSTGAADGTGLLAQFNSPAGLAVDGSGNLYVADAGNLKIRKVTPAGVVTTFAGKGTAGSADGPADSATFYKPTGIVLDKSGNIFVSDNGTIRMITPSGLVSTLAGGDHSFTAVNGEGSQARFGENDFIMIDADGSIYVSDGNGMVRKVVTTPYTISPALPAGLSFDPQTGVISGTPTVGMASTTYTITAYNMTGIGITTVTFSPMVSQSPIIPSVALNYVLSYTPRVSGLLTQDTVTYSAADRTKVETTIQYLDNLGRPVQTVAAKASPAGYDVIQPFAYDSLGREIVKYLPYVSSSTGGYYESSALSSDQNSFYTSPPSGVSAITDPYAQTAFDNSPLNWVMEQGAPGVPWQLTGVSGGGHTVKIVYTANNDTTFAADSVHSMQAALYKAAANSNQSRTLTASGFYGAGQLFVTVTKDENWVSGRAGTIEEYKDKAGRVILKRVYNYAGSVLQRLSTYYVYDDMDQLAFVLPPASGADGDGTISQTTLDNLCYQYRYDERGRLSQKKIPGKGWEYTLYNVLDQPVATQDSLQRANKNWIFTKYDGLGRPILTGIWNNAGVAVSLPTMQTTLAADSTNLFESTATAGNGYTNVSWPDTSGVAAKLTTNYYDTYKNIPGLPPIYNLSSGVSQMTRSLPTVKKTAVLNTPADQLWDVMYYDDLGRTIKTYSQHYLGGMVNSNNYDLTTTTYNFSNQPTTVTRKHYNTASTTVPLVTIANTYIYDHLGRKIKTWEQITNGNSTPTTKTQISQTDYNEIGQLLTKHLHSTDSVNFLQNITYSYNERGWLMTSSAPLFAMSLFYNTAGPTYQQFNGNIVTQYWGTPGNLNNHYSYNYDKLNRLTSGTSTIGSEQNIAYDLMGNITVLNRSSATTLIDNLSYTYIGNQLTGITDATTSDLGLKHGTFTYTYDGNGNLKTDPTKGTTGITIAYNLLNLPQSITGSKTITYTYDATGNKLRRISPNTGNTDYINGIEYDGTTASTISFIQTEEGRALTDGTTYNYEYYLGDNLGNTRVAFDAATGVARKVQQDDYYPFGMEINSAMSSPKNEYLYNKKELQEELTEYDYGARFYDPLIGRWNTIDPLGEDSRKSSSYSYVQNNPVRSTDPDGMEDTDGPYGTSLIQWEETGQAKPIYKAGGDDNDHGKNPNSEKTGYFSSLNKTISKADPITAITQNWNKIIDNPGSIFAGLSGGMRSITYNASSLLFTQTYVSWFHGVENYLKATPEEKAVSDGNYISSLIVGLGTYAPLNTGLKIPTTEEGFLGGSIELTTPIDIPVGLYPSSRTIERESFKYGTIAPSSFGLTDGFGRKMLHIIPDFQPRLGAWAKQIIPAGTRIQIGLVGPQPGNGFGTWLQIYAPKGVQFKK